MKLSARLTVKEVPESSVMRKRYRWVVDARPFGQKRKYFIHGDQEIAEAYRDQVLDDFATLAASDRSELSEEVMEQAVRATKKLKRWGASLEDAVDFYISHREVLANRDNRTVSEIVGLFLDDKERSGVSPRHQSDLKSRLNIFCKEYGETPLSMVKREDIANWVYGLKVSDQTKINYRRVLHNLFGFAIKRGVIEENPVKDAVEIKHRSNKAVILDPDEVFKMLCACDEAILPAVVVQAFCGVRSAEAYRLDWADFDLEDKELEVSEVNAKRAVHQRIIPIPDCALEWLKPIAKRRGAIAPFKTHDIYAGRLKCLRKEAGWESGTWPANALRKTFISCHIETFQNYELTAKTAGTSVDIIQRHYRKLIKPKHANRLWQVSPKSDDSVVAFKKEA